MPIIGWQLGRLFFHISITRFFVLLIGVWEGFNFQIGYCQEGLELKLMQSVYLQYEEPIEEDFKGYFDFPELYKKGVFENKKAKSELLSFLKKKHVSLEILDTLLTNYVKQFRIGNFQRQEDRELLWQLVQIKQALGDTATALFLINILLNQEEGNKDTLFFQFSQLRAPYHNDYVPLDFYYKIVEARKNIDTLIPPKKVLMKLPSFINTPYPEYAPFMHPSDATLIYSSRRGSPIAVEGLDMFREEDLYYVERDVATGSWYLPKKFTDEINSIYNEGSACLDYKGTYLIFVRCDAPGGYGSCDLYSADYIRGRWTNIQNLGPNINSPYWDSHPNLTPSGDTLFFASNRPGGFGGVDLYMSIRESNGKWGKPINLGPIINTVWDEVTPFYHPVNQTLYFASSGHIPNFGGYDIFKTRLWRGKWLPPKNLGPLINSKRDEFYYTMNGKGTKIFFAKAEEKSQDDYDIYSYELPMEARPDAIAKLAGYLIDSVTQKPLTGIIVAIDLKEGIEIAPIYINKNGYFQFHLINNRPYQLMVIGENAIYIDEHLLSLSDSLDRLLFQSVREDKPLIFERLEFEKDKWEITDSMIPKLNVIGTFLERYPYLQLEIRGHTDAEGNDKYNQKLSEKRANNIRHYLIKHFNIDKERIKAIGYGESRPIYPNDTEEHKQKNRRVEFIFHVPYAYRKEWEKIVAQKERKEVPEFHFFNPFAIRLNEKVQADTILSTQTHRSRSDSLFPLDMADLSSESPFDPEFTLIEDIGPQEEGEEESFTDPFAKEESTNEVKEEPFRFNVDLDLDFYEENEFLEEGEFKLEDSFEEEMFDLEAEDIVQDFFKGDIFTDPFLLDEFDEDFFLDLGGDD